MTEYRAQQTISISGSSCETSLELSMVVTFEMTKHYSASNEGPEEMPEPEDIVIRFFDNQGGVAVEVNMPDEVDDAFTESDGFIDWLTSEASEVKAYHLDMAADHRREMAREE